MHDVTKPASVRDAVMRLLNPWQHHFPLVAEPFGVLAHTLGCTTTQVLDELTHAQSGGALSRIGGVFAPQAGGAALLAAMNVPPGRLESVAALVSAHPGVNHNYEREGRFNLWFVMTACDDDSLEASLQAMEQQTGLPVLRLRMVKPYRIDLGFDMTRPAMAMAPRSAHKPPQAIEGSDRPLAALVEEGLPLLPRPFKAWADELGRSEQAVLDTLSSWIAQGTLRRFGMVVRHHEFGFRANAMTVFDVPDHEVDVYGERLAGYPGVTLAYRRERGSEWPFNLYCMVHGEDRDTVRRLIEEMSRACGLGQASRQILFSRRRFKQIGARRFRAIPSTGSKESGDA